MLIAVGIVAYWPASAALWRYWIEEPSLGGHGILVAALAAWLLFRARDRIDSKSVEPAPWALLLLVPCSLAALVFWKAGIQALQLMMLPAVIWLAVLAAFGPAVARSAAVPIGYLYFAMPAWNLFSMPLQELTASVVALVAPAVGLPASVSGTSVSFPNGARFIVTLACSGVGFLTQGLAVAVLLGELEDANFGRRLRLFLSMATIALVTNWVRVLLLLALGYLSGMDNVIVSQYHLEFGYILFVIVLVTFVWVATRAALPDSGARVSAPRSPAPSGYVAAVAALIAGPVLVSLWARPGHDAPNTSELRMPAAQNVWQGPLPAADLAWRPVFVGADAERHVRYQDALGHAVEAVAVGYLVQEQGRELVNEGNSLLGDRGLAALSMEFVDIDGNTYREVVAVDPGGNRSVIWSFYDIGGETFVVPLLSQLWYGMRALTTRLDSELFAFRAACIPSCADARGVLASFLADVGPDSGISKGRTAHGSSGKPRSMKFDSRSTGPKERSQRALLALAERALQEMHL